MVNWCPVTVKSATTFTISRTRKNDSLLNKSSERMGSTGLMKVYAQQVAKVLEAVATLAENTEQQAEFVAAFGVAMGTTLANSPPPPKARNEARYRAAVALCTLGRELLYTIDWSAGPGDRLNAAGTGHNLFGVIRDMILQHLDHQQQKLQAEQGDSKRRKNELVGVILSSLTQPPSESRPVVAM